MTDWSQLDLSLLMLAVSVVAVAVLRMAQLPTLLAYLLVGIAWSPLLHSLGGGGQVDLQAVTHLGEIGVVFLMFSVGLEFNLGKLSAMRRHVFGLGGAQVAITAIAVILMAVAAPVSLAERLFGTAPDWRLALVLGGALAMSSTAMIGKMLTERNEVETEHGRRIFAVLLFQDLAVIPFLVLTPALKQPEADWIVPLGWSVLKAAALLFLLLRFGEPLMRGWFHTVARRKSHELFLLNVLLVTLLGGWLTRMAGLSLELGAFVAGMLISETEYRHQVEDDIKPFRDLLLGLFFIALGMKLDLGVVAGNWLRVLCFTVALVAGKMTLTALLARMLGAAHNTALRTGLWLAQAGEFGFVLIAMAIDLGITDRASMQALLAAMILSLLLSPLLLAKADRLLLRLSGQEWLQRSLQLQRIASQSIKRDRHVIICGYGRSGQSVARVLEAERIGFVALDLDPDRVRAASSAGEPVVYGDSARRDALVAAGINRAAALIVTFADTRATLKLLAHRAELAPSLPVLVRTHAEKDIELLRSAGATEVVPEIVEGSLMLASHALALCGVPLNAIGKRIRGVRDDRYQLLSGMFLGLDDRDANDVEQPALRISTLTLAPTAVAVGHSLAEMGLAARESMAAAQPRLTALVRQTRRIVDPPPEMILLAGDTLVLSGTVESVSDAQQRLGKHR